MIMLVFFSSSFSSCGGSSFSVTTVTFVRREYAATRVNAALQKRPIMAT